MSFFSRVSGSSRVKLAQNLGAYPLESGDISPLYIFFEVSNESRAPVEIVALGVFPKRASEAAAAREIEGRELPFTLASGESVRFQVRAKTLAGALKDAGYGGKPAVRLVATDGTGREYRKDFKFRVDQYLALKDE